MAKTKAPALPSIQILFSDSWKTFKGSVLNLLILNLVSFGIFLGIIIAGVLISLPFIIFPLQEALKSKSFNPAAFGGIGIILLVVIIACIIVGLAVHAASVLFVGKYSSKPTFGKTFKGSFQFVLPLFLVGIVSSFIVLGGYMLLVIPGIFFALLFMFAPYEIILNHQGIVSALKRSARIVLGNFWGILGRLLLWVIIIMIAAFLPGILSERSAAAGAGLSGISFFVNIFLGWFGICYSLTLYKQAARGLESDKGINLLWPLLTAIVGWVIGIVMIIALTATLVLFISNVVHEQEMKQKSQRTFQLNQMNLYPSYTPGVRIKTTTPPALTP